MKSHADKWLDSEISLGKLLQLEGVSRPSGDDLAGGIANAFCDRLRTILRQLEDERKHCRLDYNEALKEGKEIDATAEISRFRGLGDAISMIYVHFGIILNIKPHEKPTEFI